MLGASISISGFEGYRTLKKPDGRVKELPVCGFNFSVDILIIGTAEVLSGHFLSIQS